MARTKSKMTRPLVAYLPDEEDGRVLVQARIPKALKEAVHRRLHHAGLSLNDLVLAAFRKFIDETEEPAGTPAPKQPDTPRR